MGQVDYSAAEGWSEGKGSDKGINERDVVIWG